MALPNFVGIGAQKAGTTPLYYFLRQHPDIFLYPQKETHFFSKFRHHSPPHFYEFSSFAGYAGQHAVGELSPEYMRTPGVARAMREMLGPIKIIICLREPVARAFSHYLHCLRAAEDNRSFIEACEADAALPPWSEAEPDIACAYVRGSRYPYQIEEWGREFGRENLFFCILERDLASDAAKTGLLQRLFAFLGVATSGISIDFNVPSVSAPGPKLSFPQHRGMLPSRRGEAIFEAGDIIVESAHFRRIVRRPSAGLRDFFETMARNMTASLTPEAARMLRRSYFTDVAEHTAELTGQDLTRIWAEPRTGAG